MPWCKRVKKWGLVTKDFCFGVIEEVFESTGNFTHSAANHIKTFDNMETINDLDSIQIKKLSRKAVAAGSALIFSSSFRQKVTRIIFAASPNLLI